MVFTPALTEEERCKRFIKLRKRIIQIKNKHGLPEDDGRVQAFNNFGWLMASITSRLNIIIALNGDHRLQPVYLKLLGVGKGDLRTVIEADLDFVRLSLVAIFQFQIENLLKNILAQITGKDPPEKYYKIVGALLSTLSITEHDEKFDILYSLATLRNCLHSNGIHTKKTKTFSIKGYKMPFIRGESYEQGDFDEIHFVMNEIFSVLEEILDHDMVIKLKAVPHQFIPQKLED